MPVGQCLEVHIAYPQPVVALWAVFVNRLHAFAQRLHAHGINAAHNVGARGQQRLFHLSGRSLCAAPKAIDGKTKIAAPHQFYLYVAEGQTPRNDDGLVHTCHGDHFVLHPCAVECAFPRVERRVQLCRHLAKRELQPHGRILAASSFRDVKAEVSHHVLPEVQRHRLSLIESGFIKFGWLGLRLVTPSLVCQAVGHGTHQCHGLHRSENQLGFGLLSLAHPCGSLVGEDVCGT